MARLGLTLATVAIGLTKVANAVNNGVGRVPLMGWNTWCTAGQCARDVCDEVEIQEVASAIHSSGLFEAGWRHIAFDDCWANPGRDPATGQLYADPARFPNGMRATVDSLHAQGFTVGIYTSLGEVTCNQGGRPKPIPGSWGNYGLDAATILVDFDADALKADWCGENHTSVMQNQTVAMYAAINATGKAAYFNFHCDSSTASQWCRDVGNSARISHDHFDAYEWTQHSIEALSASAALAGQQANGGFWWPDPDFLTTGGMGCSVPVDPPFTNFTSHCPGETDIEYKTEFTFWTMTSSLLIFATDPRNMTDVMREVLLNTELIAVNQDPGAGPGAVPVKAQACGTGLPQQCQLWHRTNSTGAHFVILFNPNDPANSASPSLPNATFTLDFSDVPGLAAGQSVDVRDMWLHQDMGTYTGTYTADNIPPHGSVALRLLPAQ